MTKRNDILNELNELGSKLPVTPLENIFTVPGGYFEGFASQVVARIRALEASDASEELGHLSPFLKNLSKANPYKVPVGYFQDLDEKLMDAVRAGIDDVQKESFGQTIDEELETLSPLLSSLKDVNPYSVPEGYFDDLSVRPVRQTRVISITSRKWFRMAAAAVVIGVVAMIGVSVLNNKQIDPNEDPQVWVEKKMKKVSTDKIEDFIKLAEAEKPYEVTASVKAATDVKELIKDIPENEIQEFLKDTEALTDDESVLMN